MNWDFAVLDVRDDMAREKMSPLVRLHNGDAAAACRVPNSPSNRVALTCRYGIVSTWSATV